MFVVPRTFMRSSLLPIELESNSLMRDMSSMIDSFLSSPDCFATMRNHLQKNKKKFQPKPDINYEIDVKDFHPDDITFKTSGNNLIVEGSYERDGEEDYSSGSFKRKLSFPSGTDMKSVKCEITPAGVLKVTSSKPKTIPVKRLSTNKRRNIAVKLAGKEDKQEKGKEKEDKEERNGDTEMPIEGEENEVAAVDNDDGNVNKMTVDCCNKHPHKHTCMDLMDYDPFHRLLRSYSHPFERLLDFFENDTSDDLLDRKVSKLREKDDRYEVEVDTKAFTPEEVQVKVTDDSVITVAARHEDNKQGSHRYSQMIQRYHLPSNANAEEIQSTLKEDGKLTITAPKKLLKPAEPETQNATETNDNEVQ